MQVKSTEVEKNDSQKTKMGMQVRRTLYPDCGMCHRSIFASETRTSNKLAERIKR